MIKDTLIAVDYMIENNDIEVIGYLSRITDLDFDKLIRQGFKTKNFYKLNNKKIYSSIDNLINYVERSTKIEKMKLNYIILKDLLKSKILILENQKYSTADVKSELQAFLGASNFEELHKALYDDLKSVRRDVLTNHIIAIDIIELVQKWSIILSYKVNFATIRGRFFRAKEFVLKSKIKKDIKKDFLSKFKFSDFLSHKINARTDNTTFDKISDKIEINKKEFDKNLQALNKFIDNLNIKLDKNLNVIECKELTIKRGASGRLINVSVEHGNSNALGKMGLFTKLSLFITLSSGRRVAELLIKPTNLKNRIAHANEFIPNFKNIANLKYNEIFMKVKNNEFSALFLNQVKKRDKDFLAFQIPLLSPYERIIKALLVLRLLIPPKMLKGSIENLSNLMRTYKVDSIWNASINDGIKNYKDCRSFYAIYNELEYNNNNVDKIVYCQEVLGHKKGLGSLKATLSYQRFVLV